MNIDNIDNIETTTKPNVIEADQEEQMELNVGGIECPYCEKKRERVDCAMSIDNEFDYCCVVCNLEYLNWKNGNQNKYTSKKLIKRHSDALRSDKKNNDIEWKSHLKTIAERSEIYARENIERKEK